jgi:hypothetical protein
MRAAISRRVDVFDRGRTLPRTVCGSPCPCRRPFARAIHTDTPRQRSRTQWVEEQVAGRVVSVLIRRCGLCCCVSDTRPRLRRDVRRNHDNQGHAHDDWRGPAAESTTLMSHGWSPCLPGPAGVNRRDDPVAQTLAQSQWSASEFPAAVAGLRHPGGASR